MIKKALHSFFLPAFPSFAETFRMNPFFTPELSHYLVTTVNYRVNRMAHNLKVVGSNPTPATIFKGPWMLVWTSDLPSL
jgi:hypothetical protein